MMFRFGLQSAPSRTMRTGCLMVVIWTLIFPPTIFPPRPLLAAFVDATHDHLPTSKDATFDMAVGDVDADGDPDVVVVNHGQSHLLLNDGQGHFTDVTSTHLPRLDI